MAFFRNTNSTKFTQSWAPITSDVFECVSNDVFTSLVSYNIAFDNIKPNKSVSIESPSLLTGLSKTEQTKTWYAPKYTYSIPLTYATKSDAKNNLTVTTKFEFTDATGSFLSKISKPKADFTWFDEVGTYNFEWLFGVADPVKTWMDEVSSFGLDLLFASKIVANTAWIESATDLSVKKLFQAQLLTGYPSLRTMILWALVCYSKILIHLKTMMIMV